ncbi:uncharacterized protein LOC125049318 [Pieris napi]|uniref:uncharacterized protein LOC125049318 n=1 Tax=Pieris napi TaxID=78633 RepID=UPI001FB9FA7D|nr:uncharacterized protein LOC125049318 [Pieris napi]
MSKADAADKFEGEGSSSDSIEFQRLINLRRSMKGRLTKFENHITPLKSAKPGDLSSIQVKELINRLNKVQSMFSEFDEVENRLEALNDDSDERDDIEDRFFSLISLAQELIESCSKSDSKQRPSSALSHRSGGSCDHYAIKLPTIKLPTFDGNYLKWLEFRDTFESMINQNDSISEINKFHYLRSSLEGGATVVIKSIEFTSKNYSLAWNLLCERYDNKNILINNHIKALFSMDPLFRESHKAIRYLIDTFLKNLRALENLDQPTDKWDVLICFIICSKLDSVTCRKWEEHKNTLPNLPSLADMILFLRNRADILETMSANSTERSKPEPKVVRSSDNKSAFLPRSSKSFVSSSSSKRKNIHNCPMCKHQHSIVHCNVFKDLPLKVRLDEVVKLNLCSNCLRRGHVVEDCRLQSTCRECGKRHNTLLHSVSEPAVKPAAVESTLTSTNSVSLSAQSSNQQVLLCTALVRVTDPQSKNTHLARALLDAGSQSCFISETLKHKMGIISNNTDSLCISGINNVKVHITDSCELAISSLHQHFNVSLKMYVVPQITGYLPNAPVNVRELNLPVNIQLADPKFYVPSDVDILLGAGVFFDAISPKQIKLGQHKPILQESKFGWLVAGPLHSYSHKQSNVIHCNFTKEISDNLTKFWNLEELPLSELTMSPEDEFCEHHFQETTKRLVNGRFCVKMPFRESPEQALGNSYMMAEKRFLNLEKKLDKNSDHKDKYTQFIKEYERLGHLSKVDRPSFGYFLPHHCVIRETSETTKLRVVFDGSAKTSSKKSLNDIQYTGPVVQDELFNILIRFRQHRFVLTGDIMNFYRQFSIDPSQRHLQLIIWRDNKVQPLEIAELQTVTYGTNSAPFLSTRCLKQLALECNDPIVSEVIQKDFYIDDMLTGSSSEHELHHIYRKVIEVLNSACLPIHKFRTNCPQIFQHNTETQGLDLCKESSVLGVLWAPDTDTLRFTLNVDCTQQKVTKRVILSNTCKIFDPLGLISPCTIALKILLQRLWLLKLDWDDPVPTEINNVWQQMIGSLNSLLTVNVPRFALCASPISTELHCFVDASQNAYAACLYLRSVDPKGIISTALLCAKTRVSPIKPLTIPRLELCAALLGARLTAKVTSALRCDIDCTYYWSDSTITLAWINSQPQLLKAFVCNRVNEIRELSAQSLSSWRYVPTAINPADMASRGLEPSNLSKSDLWWRGPSFLLSQETEWPQAPKSKINLSELKNNIQVHNALNTSTFVDFTRYSNPIRLIRIYAYVLRFISNCKNKNKNVSPLCSKELNDSLELLVKNSQYESYSLIINTLNKGNKLKPKCSILQLAPFIDQSGILRVGGRLDNATLSFEQKHPALLDSKHHFTKILMRHEHARLFHAGPQLLLSSFRKQYWPIGGRNLARSTVRKCIVCTRYKAKPMEPFMGNLPSNRVSQFYPFQTCGVDFAGPFMISNKIGRGNKISKCYLCLFICFSVKAVHLETVSDLSTQAFISSLKRFIARRGKPDNICCDNGKNFVGANNELGRVMRSSLRDLKDYSANEGIKFTFNPPYSPSLGGLWEAGIKSAKHHLKRIAGNTALTFEELSTLFTQIEAILNSRPLTPLTSDPNDLSPLTPGHFIIGRPLTSLPSPPASDLKTRIRCRYRMIEGLRQHFWARWRNEYLLELQQRYKGRHHERNLQEGDLVVFKEDGLPPLKWRIGRAVRLYMGSDNVCRVADFMTFRGIERRAVNKVCLLPLENDIITEEENKDLES